MAALTLVAVTAEVALTAATGRTVLQVLAPTNRALKLLSWAITFDGNSPTAEPVLVELLRQTTAGTMTSLTLVKWDSGHDETLQTTGSHSSTSTEPTAGDVLARRDIHPQSGYECIYPYGQEPIIPTATRLAIRAVAPANVNCIAEMRFEE
jgi:hypothetical protein